MEMLKESPFSGFHILRTNIESLEAYLPSDGKFTIPIMFNLAFFKMMTKNIDRWKTA
jgi:hypothetical protein